RAARCGGARACGSAPPRTGRPGHRGALRRALAACRGAGRARDRDAARFAGIFGNLSARRRGDGGLRARRAGRARASGRGLHRSGRRPCRPRRRVDLVAGGAGRPRRARRRPAGPRRDAWTEVGTRVAGTPRRRGAARPGRSAASRGGAVAGPRAARAEARVTLAGVRVLGTRAAEDAPELEELLRARGAVPVRMPCIAFEDGPDAGRIATIVRSARVDLAVVASPHAARRLRALCGSLPMPLAAVGAATARELPGEVIVPASGVGADALVAELRDRVRGKRVLVARAEGGNPALVDGLRAAGAEVEALTLYRTVPVTEADPVALSALREGRIDAIAFASGSAARAFAALAGARSADGVAVACMGRRCAGEAREAGIRVDAVAAGGLAELCDALALAVQSRKR